MAPRIQHEPEAVAPRSFHRSHRYMDGLRFDSIWDYPVRTSAGRRRWKALPLRELPSASEQYVDPEGAWWCVHQCALVMSQAASLAAKMDKERSACPEIPTTAEIVQVLHSLLSNWKVQTLDVGNRHSRFTHDITGVLHEHGCALLRFDCETNAGRASRAHWLWMVGIETRHQAQADGKRLGNPQHGMAALLMVGPRWSAPWGSGFGAKAIWQSDGRWKLCSVDGDVIRGRLTAAIAVKPLRAC